MFFSWRFLSADCVDITLLISSAACVSVKAFRLGLGHPWGLLHFGAPRSMIIGPEMAETESKINQPKHTWLFFSLLHLNKRKKKVNWKPIEPTKSGRSDFMFVLVLFSKYQFRVFIPSLSRHLLSVCYALIPLIHLVSIYPGFPRTVLILKGLWHLFMKIN